MPNEIDEIRAQSQRNAELIVQAARLIRNQSVMMHEAAQLIAKLEERVSFLEDMLLEKG